MCDSSSFLSDLIPSKTNDGITDTDTMQVLFPRKLIVLTGGKCEKKGLFLIIVPSKLHTLVFLTL